MLGLNVDVSQWLPPDTMSHNFDNIADVQGVSPTLLQSVSATRPTRSAGSRSATSERRRQSSASYADGA